MAIRSLLREYSTMRILPSTLPAVASVAILAVAAAAPVLGEEITELKPYTAQYQTSARGMKLDLTRNLKRGPDNTYTLTNGGKILVVGFHEVSVFRLEGSRVVPKSYVYQGTGLINRRREVHFTPGSDTIRSLYKDQWYELPYTDKTLDRMSQQEQLRLTRWFMSGRKRSPRRSDRYQPCISSACTTTPTGSQTSGWRRPGITSW